jgi:hypothetical protein
MTPLTQWQNFYVIVGSAAGGLTGLQFIAMALIADMSVKPGEAETSGAFATPTIVHFVVVLLVAATAVMPWHSLSPAAAVWGCIGLLGVIYMLFVAWSMTHSPLYKPVWEDWLYRAAFPMCAYTSLAAAALATRLHPYGCLFGIAAAVLLLLITAIQNAWDNVTYLVFIKRKEASKQH